MKNEITFNYNKLQHYTNKIVICQTCGALLDKEIISKKPSAGLWEGQTDEGEIGMSYDSIDEILYRMDYNLDFDGLNQADIDKVKRMMRAAEHKLNMPPMFEVKK